MERRRSDSGNRLNAEDHYEIHRRVTEGETFASAALLGLALAAWLAEVALAGLWLGRFEVGLAEWLWRRLAYGRSIPLRRPAPAALAAPAGPGQIRTPNGGPRRAPPRDLRPSKCSAEPYERVAPLSSSPDENRGRVIRSACVSFLRVLPLYW